MELCLPPSHSPTTTIVVATHLCEHRSLPQSPPTNPLPPLRHRTKPMPSMLQNFPAELLHAVFKNLRPAETEWASGWPMAQEVRESLSACSLVCRPWHPIAGEHLFRDLVFSFDTDSDSNQNLSTEPSEEEDARWVEARAHRMELCWYRPLQTLRMLSNYLERSPGVWYSIRRLFLVRYPPPNNGGTLHDSWGTVDPEVFVCLLTKLPLLSCLHTRNIFLSQYRLPDHSLPVVSVPKLHLDFRMYHTRPHYLNLGYIAFRSSKSTITSHGAPSGRLRLS